MSARSWRPISAGPVPISAARSTRTIREYQQSLDLAPVRKELERVYADGNGGAGLDDFDDDGIKELAGNLVNGVPIATPCVRRRARAGTSSSIWR